MRYRFPRLLPFVLFSRPWAKLLILGVSFTAAVCGLLSPYFQMEFINRLIAHQHGVLIFIVGAFVASLLNQILNLSSSYLSVKEAIWTQGQLSEKLYSQTLHLRTDTLQRRTIGEIVAVYATDVPGSTILLEQVMPQGTSIFFPLILAPIAIYYLFHLQLWLTLATMGLVIIFNSMLGFRQSRFFYKFKQLAAERTGLVNEWIQNMRTLRIMGWIEKFEEKIFTKRINETHNRVQMVTNGQIMNSLGSSVTYAINITGVISLVYFSNRPVSGGELFALLWILGVFLVRPFRQMPWFVTLSLDGMSSLRRIESYLDMQNAGGLLPMPHAAEPTPMPHAEPMPHAAEPAPAPCPLPLAIRNLSLTINNTPILQNINLDVAAGEFVAIVGEVGSGKSMLLLSLMNETGATCDRYQIGSIDVLHAQSENVKALFGYVPQEGFVMSATLRENVGFLYEIGEDQDEGILTNLHRSQFDVHREHVSGGLDAEIGERGVNLSGGQRQRVGLARADFYNRSILLLDDCLSAVDVDTEKGLLHDLLFGSWKEKTRILVTHRLSVLQKVDRIVFLENGSISAVGKFDDLLRESAHFRTFTASVKNSSSDSPPKGSDVEI